MQQRLIVRDLRLFFIGQAIIRASRRVDGGPAQPCHLADRADPLHHVRRRVDHAGFERVIVRIVEHDFVSVPNDLLVYRLVGMNAIERVHPTGVCAVASLGKRRRGAALDRSRHRADVTRVALPAIRRVLLQNKRLFDHVQRRRARRNRHACLVDPSRKIAIFQRMRRSVCAVRFIAQQRECHGDLFARRLSVRNADGADRRDDRSLFIRGNQIILACLRKRHGIISVSRFRDCIQIAFQCLSRRAVRGAIGRDLCALAAAEDRVI